MERALKEQAKMPDTAAEGLVPPLEGILKRKEKTLRLAGSVSIPGIPQKIRTVLALCGSLQSNADDIAHAVLFDFGLALHLMKTANSAFYAQSKEPILSIRSILVMLGVENIVPLASAMPRISRPGKLVASPPHWFRLTAISVLAGCIAASIARQGLMDREKNAVCAMFHSMGEIVTAFAFPDAYCTLWSMRRSRENADSLSRRLLGWTPPELALALQKKWNLHGLIGSTIRYGGTGTLPGRKEEKRTVRLAHEVNTMLTAARQRGRRALDRQKGCRKEILETVQISEKRFSRALQEALEEFKKSNPIMYQLLWDEGHIQNLLV